MGSQALSYNLGNHESDIPVSELHKRFQEANFNWLCCNLSEFFTNHEISPYCIKILDNGMKIALLGVLTDDPELYNMHSFGGARVEVNFRVFYCTERRHRHCGPRRDETNESFQNISFFR